jgi:hypothetical protein
MRERVVPNDEITIILAHEARSESKSIPQIFYSTLEPERFLFPYNSPRNLGDLIVVSNSDPGHKLEAEKICN